MIISHRHKFAFFRPPKTGTTSASFYLRICGAFDGNDTLSAMPNEGLMPTEDLSPDRNKIILQAHYTPAEAIAGGLITIEQLREYKSVAFLRDPFRRTLSAIIHQSGRFCDPTFVVEFINDYAPYIERNGLLNSWQSDWFYVDGELVVEPMLFDNYEQNLRSIIDYVGGIDFPLLPPLNSRPETRNAYDIETWYTPEFVAFVEDRYGEDIWLYNHTKMRAQNEHRTDHSDSNYLRARRLGGLPGQGSAQAYGREPSPKDPAQDQVA